jgi:hypothetical protein
MLRVIKRVIAFLPVFDSIFESRTGPLQDVKVFEVRCWCPVTDQLSSPQSSRWPWLHNVSTSETPAKGEDYLGNWDKAPEVGKLTVTFLKTNANG